MRLLVVEDDIDLQDAIKEGLILSGYVVDVCDNGEDAYEMMDIEGYDLVLLDLNIPKLSGFDLLEAIRKVKPDLKVLILSARGGVMDKVKGLDMGANDYLTKPFDFAELEARIRNILRQKYPHKENVLSYGEMQMDLLKKQVYIKTNILHLTKKEFTILEYLLLNKNRVISQEELIEHTCDINADCFSGAIRVHISSLRKKIRSYLKDDIIETKVGQGYLIVDEGDKQDV